MWKVWKQNLPGHFFLSCSLPSAQDAATEIASLPQYSIFIIVSSTFCYQHMLTWIVDVYCCTKDFLQTCLHHCLCSWFLLPQSRLLCHWDYPDTVTSIYCLLQPAFILLLMAGLAAVQEELGRTCCPSWQSNHLWVLQEPTYIRVCVFLWYTD